MVCATRASNTLHSHFTPALPPSPERIRQLTAKIRKGWSPRTRASRAALGSTRVEVLIVSLHDIIGRQLGDRD
jgi:hypothetical protein